MDALKKAEEAKRQSEARRVEPHDAAATTPAATAGQPVIGQKGLPELPSSLELLDTEFPAPEPATPPPAAPAAPPPRGGNVQRERAAAQNLFEAKQARTRSPFPLIVGLASVAAVTAIGGYFWWQMQPRGGLAVNTAAPRPAATAAPIAIAPATPPAAPLQPATTAANAAAAPTPRAEPVAAVRGDSAPALRAAPAEAPADAAASPIRITRATLRVDPTLAHAYQALSAGDLATARGDYERALKADRKSTDALHGLAAVSLRQGRPADAEHYYLRALEADPRDAVAQAGLVGLRGQGDPVQAESRLKNLLGGQPDSPVLHFALGNLYAAQGRWNEAQQSYFRAYTGDGENPDYLFNLAVSLEQLRQPRLALQYYQGALAAAAGRSAGFDKDVVAGRIRELQP